jgi:hypothetical protein
MRQTLGESMFTVYFIVISLMLIAYGWEVA